MKRNIICGLIAILLTLSIGCQRVIVNGNKLASSTSIHLVRPDESNQRIYWAKDINSDHIKGNATQTNLCRIKYHPSYSENHWMVVEGKLGNGTKYPVILDTGASIGILVNDIHIMENKLPIHPLRSSDSVGWGKCLLPQLRIGQVAFANWPCFYREQHSEVRLFGLPLAKDKSIIAGLAVLQTFKYIAFDSVNEEIEFSLEDLFKPDLPDMWTKFPFEIEEDLGGNVYLLVKIPIVGKEIELQLDTGSGRGLAISEELWDQINKDIQHVKLRNGRDLYPYIGLLTCKKGIIPNLEIGNQTIRNAQISVFPDDSPIVEQCAGMLGMQYFEDTVMVLDFEEGVMWLRNPQSR